MPNLPIVAVAGGTGSLGRAIVESLVASQRYSVFVLARKANNKKESELGARILAVDYFNTESLTSTLQDNKIEVVICTIQSYDGPQSELNLIQAAGRSTTTSRFIPSIWGARVDSETASKFPFFAERLSILEALAKTSLENTYMLNGYFADYWVAPGIATYLDQNFAVAIDAVNNVAGIPGTGDVVSAFTHTKDIAAFIPHLLGAAKWEKESSIIGSKHTLHELLTLLEETKKTTFQASHDPISKLEKGEITELPCHTQVYPYFPKEGVQGMLASFGLMFEHGVFNIKPSGPTLNEQYPEVRARTMREMVEEAWGSKE